MANKAAPTAQLFSRTATFAIFNCCAREPRRFGWIRVVGKKSRGRFNSDVAAYFPQVPFAWADSLLRKVTASACGAGNE
jgi:hypothetical protein